jgi:hypothetical protein
LIEAIAVLHQHQRPIKRDTRDGETLEYIEANEDDVRLATELMRRVLGATLDELPPQTKRLLGMIEEMVKEECERQQIEIDEYRFTRRTVRQYTRWGDTQLRVHLRRLEELEYLVVRRGGGQGQTFVYQLRTEESHSYDDNFAGQETDFAGVDDNLAGTSRPLRGAGEIDPSPVNMRSPATTSRNRGDIYKEAEENASRIVVVPVKPNVGGKSNGSARAAGAI